MKQPAAFVFVTAIVLGALAYAATPPTLPAESSRSQAFTWCWDPALSDYAMCSTSSAGGGSATSATQVTLDAKTVTTGGVAVVAIAPGNRTKGGFLQNPPTATVNMCINEMGGATGTTSFGDTTCVIPGQGYNVVAGAGGVSVIASDSAHQFSGYGLK